MTPRFWSVVVAVASLALVGGGQLARAQVPGPRLEAGAFDIGVGVRFIDRTVAIDGYDNTYRSRFHLTGGYFRYGVADWIVLSGEIAAANTHALEDLLNESNWDTRYLLVGTGMQVSLVGGERWSVVTGLHVSRIRALSRESRFCGERYTEWLAAIHLERRFRSGDQRLTVWAGPSYSSYQLDTPVGCGGWEWNSNRDWGGMAGVEATWFSHVVTSAYAIYTQHLQPRFSLSLRF